MSLLTENGDIQNEGDTAMGASASSTKEDAGPEIDVSSPAYVRSIPLHHDA